jgi:hypothetical protein
MAGPAAIIKRAPEGGDLDQSRFVPERRGHDREQG